MASSMGLGSKALNASSSAVAPTTRTSKPSARTSHVAQAAPGQKTQKGRWAGMDAGNDVSDDQQDIARGRGMVDELFQGWGGMAGTQNAIMSSHDYISTAQRSLGNIEDGFYISPAFLDKLSIHIAKNFMNLPKIKVPLILGIWGGKGQGKTFQCMLAFKKLGITPIVMSAGELESGNAGEPAKLIRQRYREASDQIKKGKMCALFINDLDAGAGRFGLSTQYTVNNQMVNATLMNIADNPTNVQLPGVYKNEEIPRVPIICTGNDFSTLYAPLIRDGRMEKYYWNPTREDRIGVCMGIFMEDNLTRGDVEAIVDAFPGQSIDFFGALRARVYDDKVREFVNSIGHENLNKRLVNSKEGKVVFEKPAMGLNVLMEYGKALVAEQDNVKRVQLADAYLGGAELAGSTGSSVPEQYEGAKGLNLEKTPSRASWRSTPAETPAPRAPAPEPVSYSPPAPAAAPASGDRWSRAASPAPQRSAGGSSGGAGGRTLSASDLAKFKIADLAEIGRKKGVSGGRDATRQSLTDALIKAGISTADLSKGQLAELNAGGSSYASIPASSSPAPAAPAPAASSGGDRWASYSRGGSSSGGSAAPAARGGSGTLSAGDLSSFKIVDLVEIAGKKGVSAGRNATREALTDGLIKAGVSLEDLSRGQLVDLAAKLGKAGLSRDLATARAELSGLIGGSGSATATWRSTPAPSSGGSGSSGSPPASWRSSGSSGSSSTASWRTSSADSGSSSSAGGDRWAKYSTGSSASSGGSNNVWRRSGSHNASGSKLSAGDLSALRIDDLRDLVKKTGAQLPREPTKDSVISGLVAKGVSLNDLTRGMLVDLSNKLGAPLGRDVDSMRKNLASVVGKSGGYSPAPAASSSGSSWRTPAAAAPAASSGGDRWASYSRSSGGSSGGSAGGASGGNVSERELSGLKIDTLSELARKKGISMRNATKQDLISQLSRVLKHSDLSKGQAAEIAAAASAPAGGRRW